jgi:hypothetical protein
MIKDYHDSQNIVSALAEKASAFHGRRGYVGIPFHLTVFKIRIDRIWLR